MYGVAPPACDERQYDARSSVALCTGAESNLRDRVLGEVKNSFIALLDKRRHMGLCPSKTVCPNPGGFDEGSKVGSLAKLGCV